MLSLFDIHIPSSTIIIFKQMPPHKQTIRAQPSTFSIIVLRTGIKVRSKMTQCLICLCSLKGKSYIQLFLQIPKIPKQTPDEFLTGWFLKLVLFSHPSATIHFINRLKLYSPVTVCVVYIWQPCQTILKNCALEWNTSSIECKLHDELLDLVPCKLH